MEMPPREVLMGVAMASLSSVVGEGSGSMVLHEGAMTLGSLGASYAVHAVPSYS